MADNALLFDGSTTYVDAGSPAALDDMAAFTAITLVRAVWAGAGNRAIIGKADAGSTVGFFLGGNNSELRLTRLYVSTYPVISSTGSTFTSNTYYWVVGAFDSTGAELMSSAFGASVVSRGTAGASGGLISDAAEKLTIGTDNTGGTPGYIWDNGIAFAGIISGKKSVAQVQAIIDSMSTQTWLMAMRTASDGTVSNAGSSGTLTKNGSFGTLITTAPDYWTGTGGGGGSAKSVPFFNRMRRR